MKTNIRVTLRILWCVIWHREVYGDEAETQMWCESCGRSWEAA